MERLWKKNLDQKFDLTQKLEQFPEKKVGPPKSDLILHKALAPYYSGIRF